MSFHKNVVNYPPDLESRTRLILSLLYQKRFEKSSIRSYGHNVTLGSGCNTRRIEVRAKMHLAAPFFTTSAFLSSVSTLGHESTAAFRVRRFSAFTLRFDFTNGSATNRFICANGKADQNEAECDICSKDGNTTKENWRKS